MLLGNKAWACGPGCHTDGLQDLSIIPNLCWTMQEVNEAMQAALRPEALAKYAIKGTDAEFGALEGQSLPNTGVVSVLNKKLPKADAGRADHSHQ